LVEVTILWDDGSMFLTVLPSDNYSEAEAVEQIWDEIERHETIHGRWMGEEGPQEQFRLCKFSERGIRCVMVDVNWDRRQI
jgi:hypothetical protein